MVRMILVCVVVLSGLVTMPRLVFAGCNGDLLDCYGRAAQIDNFWYRTAAGLDCELDYASCLRLAMIGA
jgi:hypothetical protein